MIRLVIALLIVSGIALIVKWIIETIVAANNKSKELELEILKEKNKGTKEDIKE